MEIFRCRTANKAEEIEKLSRKKEINERYSRLMLSKTIKYFQKKGHVTICLSEKLNVKAEVDADDKIQIKKSPPNRELNEPKKRSISFWQFPSTLTCEFQFETNRLRATKSIRSQTQHKTKTENTRSPNQYKNVSTSTTNEILSSHVSSDGNVMRLVLRSNNNENIDRNQIRSVDQSSTKRKKHPPTEAQKSRSQQNAYRSKNFWASYNNFILCNRTIELRITKLISFQNTQYIVAFSQDFFAYNKNRDANPLKLEKCYVIQFKTFNIDACVSEKILVEHTIDCKTPIICNEVRRRPKDAEAFLTKPRNKSGVKFAVLLFVSLCLFFLLRNRN